VELRNIGTHRQFDTEVRGPPRRVVMAFQSAADLSGLHTNNGVVSRGIIRAPPEKLSSQGPLLKEVFAPLKFLANDKGKKLLAASAVRESSASKYRFQFVENCGSIGAGGGLSVRWRMED